MSYIHLKRTRVFVSALLYTSEVDTYMDLARKLAAKEEDLLWSGKCNYTPLTESFEFLSIIIPFRKILIIQVWKIISFFMVSNFYANELFSTQR
ncbi:hypothetical protein LCGC14_2642320 [marine sediment metagenome]|uniref:Uncharacterized protein n=1 Tax=marine sediment metagenome TaxID=412755 RepID=A0A0F9CPE3_9ZZZZ